MASPTLAEIQDQSGKAIKVMNEFRKYAGTSTAGGSATDLATNYLTHEDSLVQALEGNYTDQITAGLLAFRSDLNRAIQRGPELMTGLIREFGRFIGAPETDLQSIITRLYLYMIDNTLRVTSRVFTFGSPAAGGGNVGTGVINRLNKDMYNFDIEAQTPDAKKAKCINDEHSGQPKHEELFEIVSTSALERDLLKITGSGKFGRLKAISARDSLPFLQNPSLDQSSGSGGSFALTNWNIDTPANVTADTTNYYRDFEGASTPASARFELAANARIYQDISTIRASFDPNTPYYAQIAWRRDVSTGGDGTLTFRFGNKSVAVVAAAQAGWQILRIAIGENNWFRQFDKGAFTVEIERSGATVGYIHVDDVIIAPYQGFDGSWYAPVGGATKFLWNDSFTWSDSCTESIIQQWFWRMFGRYLPHATGGSVTWAEPS